MSTESANPSHHKHLVGNEIFVFATDSETMLIRLYGQDGYFAVGALLRLKSWRGDKGEFGLSKAILPVRFHAQARPELGVPFAFETVHLEEVDVWDSHEVLPTKELVQGEVTEGSVWVDANRAST